MKKSIIISVVISLIVILGVIIFSYIPVKDISQMTDEEFIQLNLKQTEVIRTIGNEEVVRTQVSLLTAYSQENKDILNRIRPTCSDLISIGTPIRTMTFYTERRQIGTIWTTTNNKMICVVSDIIHD